MTLSNNQTNFTGLDEPLISQLFVYSFFEHKSDNIVTYPYGDLHGENYYLRATRRRYGAGS